MSAALLPNRKATTSIGQIVLVSDSMENNGPVQETIRQLQNEVRNLQEDLARTRRALGQREVWLRNACQRELELRAEAGAGKKGEGVRQFDLSPRIA